VFRNRFLSVISGVGSVSSTSVLKVQMDDLLAFIEHLPKMSSCILRYFLFLYVIFYQFFIIIRSLSNNKRIMAVAVGAYLRHL
jgi:hypothetical protein